ncbi:hypothetical protein ECZU03_05480 [Escherichia coli]|nr:hypothetical protein ECZU03_05480 [Escherichia coli]
MKRAGYKCYSAGDSDGRGIGKRMGNVHYLRCQPTGTKRNEYAECREQ